MLVNTGADDDADDATTRQRPNTQLTDSQRQHFGVALAEMVDRGRVPISTSAVLCNASIMQL